ncbi:hypothetical protein [Actinomarinicola tropica]|uniref:Uncharacterized protein n=1 Tax=Actinomarinicola tropica TaxID=2789776 RepID=A0A5Q2RKS8_9ACTN|nr:hypothetical protein [Actinomarinicola tropica]QGG93795.1 hypothetical protein GH723_00975 [Actinomarinicola tropica]
MVAFVVSILIAVVLTAAIFPYMKRRPVGTPLTWGEAMFAAVYVFFILFWIYGVVPHQWLMLADNEWGWRPDALVLGPGSETATWLPLTFTKETFRDLIAVVIYGIALVANVVVWMMWQNRGKTTAPEVETSRYGRPLVKGA